MARIPDDELERIKRETDLVALVQAAGVELRRHGANVIGRCPFHDDQGPSLVVTPAKNLWHCLGACQAGGSAIDWVMRTDRVSFRHAVELLRMRLGGGSATSPAPAVSLAPLATKVTDAEAIDEATLVRAVLDFYHETLKASPEAIAYLAQRGLNSVELIDHFRLGYANRTLAYRLPSKAKKAGADLRGRLERLGLLRESGHEHFRGSLVVPILGERGQLVQCYGRKIAPKLREGTPLHLYLPGPHAAVWNVDALAASKEIILCESLIDAMTFWVAGYRNVITSYGVSGFTEAHRIALRRYGTERVLVAYDADVAGDRGAEQVAEELARMGIECYRVPFPRGLDANAYALANVPASESLGMLLRGATWLGRGEPIVTSPKALSSLAAAPVVTPLPAGTLVATPPSPLTTERRGDDVFCVISDRSYRVRGLAKNLSPDALRVNLLAKRGEDVHVDTLDLYVARVRGLFIVQAAKELGLSEETIKRDVGAVIPALETLVAEQIAATLAPTVPVANASIMSDVEREAALALLRDPQLLDRILADFERAGVVGEETNKLVGYLAAVSRKLPEPLAIIIQSASAAGKTSLMDAVLAFVPTEERVQYSAMTGQALFYMAETDLKHKVLAVVEEEGAERASYALKLLQSEGELTIASTGKDPETGKLVTHEYRVEGPVMIMLTTTAVELDEELVNRALVLSVDEDRDQTRAIHQRQRARRTLDGRLASVAKAELLALHRNAQRLIEPITIVNPYAPQLTFVDARTRARRDHEKYLTLIDVVALLHQHQRERKTVTRGAQSLTYIEVTREDIAVANRLAAAVLGRSLDELPPQTRRFLDQLEIWVTRACAVHRGQQQDFRFLARQAREATGLGATQVKLHLRRLVELEYVLVHRAPRGQGVSYELVYTAAEHTADATIFSGLREVQALTNLTYDDERSDQAGERSDLGRGPVGGRSVAGRSAVIPRIARAEPDLGSGASVAADLATQEARQHLRRTVVAAVS
ncbi:MAG: primase [Gemmatimonadetes bacterium]|nr:primase [Gemmatimonadota bacterium]